MSTRQRTETNTPKAWTKADESVAAGRRRPRHQGTVAWAHKGRDRRVLVQKLSLQETGSVSGRERRKRETRKLCLTFVGEILCQSPGSYPGRQTLTSSGVATPQKAGPGRSGPAGRPPPAFSCYQRAPGPRARRPGVCAHIWELGSGYPGTCPRARAPACTRRLGSRAQSAFAFWESIRTRRARSSPVFQVLVRRIGRWSGSSLFPRLSFGLVGQEVISPLGRLATPRSSSPPA